MKSIKMFWLNKSNKLAETISCPITINPTKSGMQSCGSWDRPSLSSGCKIPHKPNLTQMVRHFNCDCNFFKMAISPRKIFLSFPIFNFLFFLFHSTIFPLHKSKNQKPRTSRVKILKSVKGDDVICADSKNAFISS